MRRFYVPGANPWFGGVWVQLRDGDDDGGTLAAPTTIRDVAIPAGSRLAVDCDFAHLDVMLAAPTRVHGHVVPEGTKLHFLARILAIPARHTREVWVMPPVPLEVAGTTWRPDIYFTIRRDGSAAPIL